MLAYLKYELQAVRNVTYSGPKMHVRKNSKANCHHLNGDSITHVKALPVPTIKPVPIAPPMAIIEI